MNRRNFVKVGLLAGLMLVLPRAPAATARQAERSLRLQRGEIVNADNAPVVRFGSDVKVTALHQRKGVWYARLEQPETPSFWLKSYNGRHWGTLAWHPRRNSAARN